MESREGFRIMSTVTVWLLVGFLGQVLFTARFVLQWLASEQRGDSVVPVMFWWLSLAGGTAMLAYAISRRDPVFMTGQALGLVVYARNLTLVSKAARRGAECGTPVSSREVPVRVHSKVSQVLGN
jgi:lipid-A-disaccharide synthase-like uncharacterized protein